MDENISQTVRIVWIMKTRDRHTRTTFLRAGSISNKPLEANSHFRIWRISCYLTYQRKERTRNRVNSQRTGGQRIFIFFQFSTGLLLCSQLNIWVRSRSKNKSTSVFLKLSTKPKQSHLKVGCEFPKCVNKYFFRLSLQNMPKNVWQQFICQ